MGDEKKQLVKASLENVKAAAKIVQNGGLIVYPTETVYGLGCDPFNCDAVERLIRVKGRRNKALPLLAHDIMEVEKVAELSDDAKKIAKRFWPGPLTLVLPKKELPDIVTFGSKTVGVRVPDHKVTLELVRLCGGLLIGSSANKSGGTPPRCASDAYEQLGREVDMVLDGGSSEFGVSSTVVDLSDDMPKLLRRGLVNFDCILQFWNTDILI